MGIRCYHLGLGLLTSGCGYRGVPSLRQVSEPGLKGHLIVSRLIQSVILISVDIRHSNRAVEQSAVHMFYTPSPSVSRSLFTTVSTVPCWLANVRSRKAQSTARAAKLEYKASTLST